MKKLFFEKHKPINITPVLCIHGPGDSLAIKEKLKSNINKKTIYDKIAKSQFLVAQTILAHPESTVVMEGIDKTLTKSWFQKNLPNKIQLIRENFCENNFGKSFDDLNEMQKKLLRKFHGPMILLALNFIPAIYPSISEKLNQRLLDKFSECSESLKTEKIISFNDRREIEALKYSKEAAKHSGRQSVLLIFGALHDFTKHPKSGFNLESPINCSIDDNLQLPQNFPETNNDPAWKTPWDFH